MAAELLVIVVLPLLLISAAGWDVASYTIPNFIQLALVAAFAVFAVAAHIAPGAIGAHFLAGLAGLAVGFALFARGLIGGGDAKLLAATMLWLGFSDVLGYLLFASLIGGALTLLLLSFRQITLPQILARQAWISRLHDKSSGIPYGVALAAGAVVILPGTEIFRIAATG